MGLQAPKGFKAFKAYKARVVKLALRGRRAILAFKGLLAQLGLQDPPELALQALQGRLDLRAQHPLLQARPARPDKLALLAQQGLAPSFQIWMVAIRIPTTVASLALIVEAHNGCRNSISSWNCCAMDRC